MEINLVEKTSRLVKTFVVEQDSYKATTNLTVEGGKIINLNGTIAPIEQGDEPNYGNPSFHAYKRNGKWCTDVTGAANDEQDAISDICVAIVNQIVAEYEAE